jgi:glucose-6-phosphate dehydrogenase assembly protein OpcA
MLWREEDTSVEAVLAALRRHAFVRSGDDAHPRPRARALTLIVVCDDEERADAEAVARVAHRHPLRAVVVVRRPDGDPRLDAVMRRPDEVELRVHGPAADHLASLVAPLLLPELPAVFWWMGPPPVQAPAYGELVALCDRGVVDMGDRLLPLPHPERVEDVAWRRSRPWRDIVASLFDPPEHRGAASAVREVRVAHVPAWRLTALLLGGWLAARLRLPPAAVRLEPAAANAVVLGAYAVRATSDGHHAEVRRPGEPTQRARLPQLATAEVVAALLATPPDPLWPEALAAALAVAGAQRS